MTERANNSERDKSPEPTPAQKAASQIAFFLEVSSLIKKAAKETGGTKKEKKETRDALTDLYFIQANKLPIDPFNEKWGKKASIFTTLLEQINPELDKAKEEAARSALELNGYQRTKIALKATKKLTGLSKEQHKHLFEMGGYFDVSKKLSISGGLTLAT